LRIVEAFLRALPALTLRVSFVALAKVRATEVALGRRRQSRELPQLEARVQAREHAAGPEAGRR